MVYRVSRYWVVSRCILNVFIYLFIFKAEGIKMATDWNDRHLQQIKAQSKCDFYLFIFLCRNTFCSIRQKLSSTPGNSGEKYRLESMHSSSRRTPGTRKRVQTNPTSNRSGQGGVIYCLSIEKAPPLSHQHGAWLWEEWTLKDRAVFVSVLNFKSAIWR